jgi:hypothetical protein
MMVMMIVVQGIFSGLNLTAVLMDVLQQGMRVLDVGYLGKYSARFWSCHLWFLRSQQGICDLAPATSEVLFNYVLCNGVDSWFACSVVQRNNRQQGPQGLDVDNHCAILARQLGM